MAKRFVHSLCVVPLAAVFLAAAVWPACSTATERPAPPFELRTIDGSTAVSSADLFSAHRHVFLVFWSAGCPHCVEALRGAEEFHRRSGGSDVAVVGVNADDRSVLELNEILQGGGVTFQQLRDPGGAVSDAYGVPFEIFTLVHVEGGTIVGTRKDPEGEASAALEEMLLEDHSAETALVDGSPSTGEGRSGATVSEGAGRSGAGEARLVVHGRERLRITIVDTRSPAAKGLYGEYLNPGRTVLQRFEAEGTAVLTEHLRAGGLLRISNEDEAVLDAGPAYYGSPWGSAFVEISTAHLDLRLGYYSIYMTPLTLMRWDWDDNPRIGGDAGCGCGPAAGTILFESLEELGPELTFEGTLATVSSVTGEKGSVEVRAFYAMPRRATETPYIAYRSGADPRAQYSLEIAGAEALWQMLDGRTGSFFKASARVLASFENRSSVDFPGLGYSDAPPSTNTALAGVSVEVPLLSSLRLRGELVPWNRVTEKEVATTEGVRDFESSSSAGMAGFVFEPSPRHLVQADYLKLGTGYVAPFAALSYESNMDGIRVSARETFVADDLSFSVFYRRLHEVETPDVFAEAGRKQSFLAGVSIDAGDTKAWAGGIGWLDNREWRERPQSGGGWDASVADARRRAIVAYLSRGFESYGVVRLEYQRVGTGISAFEDPYADIWSLDASIRF